MRFGPHDTAAGPELNPPPKLPHALQAKPSQAMCQRALSWPRANTSRRLEPHDATAGPSLIPPPRSCQLPHFAPDGAIVGGIAVGGTLEGGFEVAGTDVFRKGGMDVACAPKVGTP